MMKGFYRVTLTGIDSKKRTGEQKLMVIERELRKAGIAFVEDFDSDNTVIVRYGAYVDDAVFAQAVPTVAASAGMMPVYDPLTREDEVEAVVDAIMNIARLRHYGRYDAGSPDDWQVRAQYHLLVRLYALSDRFNTLQDVHDYAQDQYNRIDNMLRDLAIA